MSKLGVGEDIAELAIGHVRADLIARYNKDEAWDGRSDACAREGAAVIPLRAKAQPEWPYGYVSLFQRAHFSRNR
jgi:hypothetical protein